MRGELNESRIAKNTFLLYIRLLLTVVVGLYTSRLILDKLGVDDFGVYSVVGGTVAMMSFLNSAMVVASQRFLSYELGNGNEDRLKKVFNTSVLIHMLIAGVILLIAETLGLWLVNNYLNIPSDRMFAANCVYQISIVIFLLTIFTVPFNSCVIAHERMDMFAYTSIIEYMLKLGICFLIGVVPFDKLIIYSILLLLVSIIISGIYIVYCRRNFSESKITFLYDKVVFREMFSFAGWNIFGNIGSSFKEQLVNIILNVFCGTKVNAARGIAMQVNGVVNTLASNIAMAVNPQITKQYAAGNIEKSKNLVFACARYSFFLLMLIAVPFILNVEQILEFWLVDVPEYTLQFTIIAIIVSLIYTLTGSVSTAIQATGRVRTFQVGVCVIMLVEVPMTYLFLKLEYSPVVAVLPSLITNIIALLYRYVLINNYIALYGWKEYITEVLLRAIMVFIVVFIISFCVRIFLPSSVLYFAISIIQSVFTAVIVIYLLGLSAFEKRAFINIIKMRTRSYG